MDILFCRDTIIRQRERCIEELGHRGPNILCKKERLSGDSWSRRPCHSSSDSISPDIRQVSSQRTLSAVLDTRRIGFTAEAGRCVRANLSRAYSERSSLGSTADVFNVAVFAALRSSVFRDIFEELELDSRVRVEVLYTMGPMELA